MFGYVLQADPRFLDPSAMEPGGNGILGLANRPSGYQVGFGTPNYYRQASHPQVSPSTPEFIDTDFTKSLFAEAQAANAHIPRNMDLSLGGSGTNPPPVISSVSAIISPSAPGLTSVGCRQSSPHAVLQAPNGQSCFTPAASMSKLYGVTASTVGSIAAHPPMLLSVPISQSLAGAAILSPPLQVLPSPGFRPTVSCLPSPFSGQAVTALGTRAVLMPVHTAGLMPLTGPLHRSHVISAPSYLSRPIQPKPASPSTSTNNFQRPPLSTARSACLSAVSPSMVNSSCQPLIVNTSSICTSGQVVTPNSAHSPRTAPQVLNIPRVPRMTSPLHMGRKPEPRAPSPLAISPSSLHSMTPPTAHTPTGMLPSPQAPVAAHTHSNPLPPHLSRGCSPLSMLQNDSFTHLPSPPSAHQPGNRTPVPPCTEEPENLSARSAVGPVSLKTSPVFKSEPEDSKEYVMKAENLNFTKSIVDQLRGSELVNEEEASLGVSVIDKKRAAKLVKQEAADTPKKCDASAPDSKDNVTVPHTKIKSEPSSVAPSPTNDGTQKHSEAAVEPVSEKTTIKYNDDKIPMEYDDPEFVWEDYLEQTGAQAAPPTSFKHVERSLESGLRKGMKVEVANKNSVDTFWVATVVMTCGQLLRLRYDGYDDNSSSDFWCDVATNEMHPVGWCDKNNKTLEPPEGIKQKCDNWKDFLVKTLQGAETAPEYLLSGCTGTTPIDQIKEGMRLEVHHELQPKSMWIACVLENVGGRLLLRYEGTQHANHDFWLFYLHYRLHPIGWASDHDCIYKPPEVILSEHKNYTEWSEILQTALKDAERMPFPKDVFKDQVMPSTHSFKVGWKLEALVPSNHTQFAPATVVQVIDDHFFLVEFDDLNGEGDDSDKIQICCHGQSREIFPANWCNGKGLRLTPPRGWEKPEFNWNEYLAQNNGKLAPPEVFDTTPVDHEFARNQKLEVVNPEQPGQLCAATISRIIDNLLWIHLDSSSKLVSNLVLDVESQNIFPVGWCESNGYPLKPPRKSMFPKKKVAVVQPERTAPSNSSMSADEIRSATYSLIKFGDSGGCSSWCPKIYFNHRCFSGPFLSKGRIAELPKSVGPGPINLVLKEVLTMLINVAYKSSRVLRELQMENPANPEMNQQLLKAKYKGKSYRAVVEICRSQDQIEEFCRQVCIKLECCPNLCSPQFVNGICPENCFQLTKTKYTYYYGKKKRRKIGRPPGGHTNLENGPRRPGKRRKRRKVNLITRKKRSSVDSEETINSETRDDEVFDDTSSKSSDRRDDEFSEKGDDSDFRPPRKKRRYTHKVPTPSIIRTRGAKLPKFTFERRTHRKVAVQSAPACLQNTEMFKSTASPPRSNFQGEEVLQLTSNPLKWTVAQVIKFMKKTDCAHLVRLFKEQEIDGQALLMLTLPTVQEHLELKLGPAIKLCHHIERVKIAFYEQYA